MKRIRMMICVNDAANGLDTERVDAIQLDLHGMDNLLELNGQPLVCRTIEGDACQVKQLQVGRLKMPVYGYANWVGNWCWDCATVDLADAVRVVNYVRQHEWDCEAGVTSLYNAFNQGKDITAEDLQKAIDEPNWDEEP